MGHGYGHGVIILVSGFGQQAWSSGSGCRLQFGVSKATQRMEEKKPERESEHRAVSNPHQIPHTHHRETSAHGVRQGEFVGNSVRGGGFRIVRMFHIFYIRSYTGTDFVDCFGGCEDVRTWPRIYVVASKANILHVTVQGTQSDRKQGKTATP
ncbi:hypothetical protein BDW02DRAFT_403715 [Decorospora gaudefroyi]|uniref:Uncharacterized protein n=1 Tax=Decorospora gaudefroyi TaxID=184978 RepID=A0A6A5KHP6_9PLEO|nr:hypothetical protein BDW02DRAFT_403715 [Decorospora gaudefroyi]